MNQLDPMTYEVIRVVEKRNQNSYKVYRYTRESFKFDFKILLKLYRLSKTQRIDPDIDIYFKIKFFRQLEKFPFINPMAYMNLKNGLDLAIKDVTDLAIQQFL